MAKIDLDLINSDGGGKPVPKKMDRHIVKFVIRNRKKAVENDSSLLQTERWDHSDVFYAARTWLNQHNWDTSVYNDNAGGADRRKDLYHMIKEICEDFYIVKRHQIGIYPEDRAVMAYGGVTYAASFDNLDRLMYYGTDVVCVEKQGTVIKMVPFTENIGIAFIQSQGFISEYGIALAQLTVRDKEARTNYLPLNSTAPYKANLGNLTDCDSSGIVIGMKVKGAARLGIDLDTIDEINQVNEGLEDEWGTDLSIELELEDLEESNEANSHWDGLVGISNRTGELYKSLTEREKNFYYCYLNDRPRILGGDMTNIEYLKEHRIELNTVLAIIKPQAFWNWLRWKLLETWPRRNYLRGGLTLGDNIRTPTMNRFIDWYHGLTRAKTESVFDYVRIQVGDVEGMYDDVDGFQDNVPIVKRAFMGDVMNNVVLQDDEIQKIDLGLENIMKNGNGSSDEPESEEDDEDEVDGNEWDE